MPKKAFQDVVPPPKRTIRDIPIPDGRKIHRVPTHVERKSEPEEGWTPPPSPQEKKKRRNPGGTRYGLWILVFVVLLVLAFAVSSLFAGATVRVTPRNATADVSGTFSASRNGENGALPFDVIKVTRDESKEVAASATATPATSTPESRKATGTIIVYNNQSSSPQGLVANTRFQTPDGLIYRISKAITIPGSTIKNGEKVPGSVEATVVADQSGEKYNIELTDFKIPGFKGDARYETIYARSKTAMTGGGVAKQNGTRSASMEVINQAKDEMQFTLKEQLFKDVQAQIPADYTTFDNGLIYEFEDLPTEDSGTNGVKLTERGTLYAVIFKKTTLGQAVAERFLTAFSGGDIVIANLPELDLTLAKGAPFNPSDTAFELDLKGSAKFVWRYDEEALKKDMAGQGKTDVDRILARYPSVQSAEVIVRPVWNRALPKDTQKITIENTVSGGQ